jgi:lipoate-protein ligase A
VIDQVSGTLVKTPAAKKGCIGGRVIYIDRNQLIFHVAVPLARAPWPAARLMPMVLAAMVDTMGDFGLAARARAPSDIAVDDRKITGAAGRRSAMLW